jgi:dTDP-4-dehydrorhamnose reductase
MKCLLFGATGFLGRNLMVENSEHSEIDWVGVSRAPRAAAQALPGINWIALDDWAEALPTVDAVVHAMAITDLTTCEQNEQEAIRVNAIHPIRVAERCKGMGIPFLFFSTDGLFGGSGRAPRPWTTEDQPRPVNAYGRSKLIAEQGINDLRWGQIVRCSFVGPSHGTRRGLIAFLAKSIHEGVPEIVGFGDRYFTPISTKDLCRRSNLLLAAPDLGYGLHHWACAQTITKAEYLDYILTRAGVDLAVRVVTGVPMPGGYPAPEDQSLACLNPQSLACLLEDGVQALQEELT